MGACKTLLENEEEYKVCVYMDWMKECTSERSKDKKWRQEMLEIIWENSKKDMRDCPVKIEQTNTK